MKSTSVAVSEATRTRLVLFKKQYNLRNCDEVIEVMLRYFDAVGDDPVNPQFTAKAQIGEVLKRLNQVIAFIRTFEKDNLRPVLNEIIKANKQMLATAPSNGEQVSKGELYQVVQEAVKDFFKNINNK